MNNNDKKASYFQFARPLLIGATAGCLAVFITNPIDLAKTRLQLQGELQTSGTYQKQINGVYDTIKKTIQYEGRLAIYKGLSSAIIFQIVMNGFRLGMYENLKNTAQNIPSIAQYQIVNIVSSFTVGFVGGFLGSPFNLVKTRLMLQSPFLESGQRYQYLGLSDAIKQIIRVGGVFSLFTGSRMWGMRTGIGSGVQLPSFDQSLMVATSHLKLEGFQATVFASFLSTFILCIVLCPIDGLATRYFNQPYGKDGIGLIYRNGFEGASKIIKIEGFLGLYKGFIALLARLGPHSILTLVIFNQLNKSLQY